MSPSSISRAVSEITQLITRLLMPEWIKFPTTLGEIVVYLTSLCVNWAFFGTRVRVPKRPNLHTNELNTTFFCSTSPLKAPNRLKPLKLA
jgi:hypothetical protein